METLTDAGLSLTPAAVLARLTDAEPVLFHVCAWHTPKAELVALARRYPGQISHGMCAACRVHFEAGGRR